MQHVAHRRSDEIARLNDLVAKFQRELHGWNGLTDAVREMRGFGPDWPSHGNAPLAIAAGYQLALNRVVELERELAAEREVNALCAREREEYYIRADAAEARVLRLSDLNSRLINDTAVYMDALRWYADDGSTHAGIDVGQRARTALSRGHAS